MNWVLIGIFILAIISILVVFLISRNVDCSQKDGSADHVATYVFDKKLKSCIPSTCMDGYGPLTSDGTCPESTDCSKKDGTADHVKRYIYDGSKCIADTCEDDSIKDHVTKYVLDLPNNKCVASECDTVNGYSLSNGACIDACDAFNRMALDWSKKNWLLNFGPGPCNPTIYEKNGAIWFPDGTASTDYMDTKGNRYDIYRTYTELIAALNKWNSKNPPYRKITPLPKP
jgi:hypothetical protein